MNKGKSTNRYLSMIEEGPCRLKGQTDERFNFDAKVIQNAIFGILVAAFAFLIAHLRKSAQFTIKVHK